ncbi:hypothetical protein B7494_g1287 [Chlorociboria aeruginascens]|nr:hypothetical protein B7494_g1287 [Chlorociboria aeruginascens]
MNDQLKDIRRASPYNIRSSDTSLSMVNIVKARQCALEPTLPPESRGISHYHVLTGKRKKAAKKPTGPRKNEPLATTFPCLFCNHEKSVAVKLDKKAGVGQLSCKVCDQKFQCAVNCLSYTCLPSPHSSGCFMLTVPPDLSAAVDVYSEWVDACDAVAKEDGEDRGSGFAPARVPPPRRSNVGRARDEEEDDNDIINDDDDDDDDGLGGYAGEGIVGDDEY